MAALHKRDYRRLSLPSGGSMPCDPDEAAALQALQALLAMTLPERIAAVIADLESRTDRFACVEAHELAEALGIEDAWAPGGDWSFERRADDLSLEEYAQRHSTASEMLDWLSPTELRAKTLAKRAAEFDAGDLEDFGFLSREERATIKRAIDRLLLDWNWGNGRECYATFALGGEDIKAPMYFEGLMEDDGVCHSLRTPYEMRDQVPGGRSKIRSHA